MQKIILQEMKLSICEIRVNAKLGKLGDGRGGRSGEWEGGRGKVNMTYFTYLESPK